MDCEQDMMEKGLFASFDHSLLSLCVSDLCNRRVGSKKDIYLIKTRRYF